MALAVIFSILLLSRRRGKRGEGLRSVRDWMIEDKILNSKIGWITKK